MSHAPNKPSDYRAWQDGFQEAYQQARKVILYGHTNVKDENYQNNVIEKAETLLEN